MLKDTLVLERLSEPDRLVPGRSRPWKELRINHQSEAVRVETPFKGFKLKLTLQIQTHKSHDESHITAHQMQSARSRLFFPHSPSRFQIILFLFSFLFSFTSSFSFFAFSSSFSFSFSFSSSFSFSFAFSSSFSFSFSSFLPFPSHFSTFGFFLFVYFWFDPTMRRCVPYAL